MAKFVAYGPVGVVFCEGLCGIHVDGITAEAIHVRGDIGLESNLWMIAFVI